ncbi:MAG: SH3 domain-containing protein, partial [Candidatus Omnitrophota bacterium]
MMKKTSLFTLIFCLTLAGCATVPLKPASSVPISIPNTIREMKSPGFWIKQHPYPDKLILDESGVALFNAKIEKELNFIINPLNESPQYNGKKLKNDLAKEFNSFSKRKLYVRNGKLADKNFYNLIEPNMNLSILGEKIDARYGFLLHYADQRLLPVNASLNISVGDLEFDELQNSSLDAGTPLIILHETKDGFWVYAESLSSSGWLEKEKIVYCEAQEFKDVLTKKNFVVVISAKADIFLDESLTKYYDYVRMGAKFIFNETANPKVFEILIPAKTEDNKFFMRKAYIKKENANIGYLSYTPRNIIEQAFKLFNAPYGWGGTGGEQDCSSYMQEIFQTVGITLPRNSSAQG